MHDETLLRISAEKEKAEVQQLPPQVCLRDGFQLGVSFAEDGADVGPERDDRGYGHKKDDTEQNRIFREVLPFIVKPNVTKDLLHKPLLSGLNSLTNSQMESATAMPIAVKAMYVRFESLRQQQIGVVSGK
jgi:hypothetical protein